MNILNNELSQKAAELKTQRRERQEKMVDITLKAILAAVTSKEADIMAVMTAGKGQSHHALREIVEREITRAAKGRLWCREYDEKSKSNQQVLAYTGSHWQRIEPQQWMDFVRDCAEQCGLPESLLMNQSFMKPLFEGMAFNLAQFRRQEIPADEVWVNLRNGTLVVKADGSVTLREHRMADLFTNTLNYVYDPQAECPLWTNFLNRVLPEPESQTVLAEFIGYCLMSDHRFERMLWLLGPGQNGKSVTLETIEGLLGSANVSYLSLSDLTNDEVKRAGIEGKMLNISHESGKDVNPNVLKLLTSGERVLVKQLYHDPRETRNYGQFICAFNQLPRAELTFGFFRRLLILPFSVTIPQEEVDRQLAQKLYAELSGILNWVLKTLPPLMTNGEFTASKECEKALEQYKLQSDNVRLFVNEMCDPCEYSTEGSEIFMAYRSFCLDSSLKPLGKNRFYERFEALVGSPEMYGNLKRFKVKVNAES